jgi:hypothetical protein
MPTAARAIVSLVLLAPMITALAPLPARAAESEGLVHDGGAFFSAAALSEAAEIIRSIAAFHGRDVYVETYAEVPEHLRADLARDGREKFYDDWLNRRARQLGIRGVFVLVTRAPGRVQVGVDKATQRRAFTPDDRDALRDALVTAFRASRYDQGLLDGLRFVRRRMDENTAAEASPVTPVWH